MSIIRKHPYKETEKIHTKRLRTIIQRAKQQSYKESENQHNKSLKKSHTKRLKTAIQRVYKQPYKERV